LNERGPVAVFAGSRVTMPYGNTTAAVGLINGIFNQKLPRLGDAWLSALRQMQTETTDPNAPGRIVIDSLAMLISPSGTKLPDERHEHMLLYNLLGDPTLRLQHPQQLDISRSTDEQHPRNLQIKLTSPISGTVIITVDRPLGAVKTGDPNHTTLFETRTTVEANKALQLELRIPESTTGPVIVRGMVSGENAWASDAFKTILN